MTSICFPLLYYLLIVDIEYKNYYYFLLLLFFFASLEDFVLLHLHCEEPDDKTTSQTINK